MSGGSNSELPFADSLGPRIYGTKVTCRCWKNVNIEGKSRPLYPSTLSILHSRSELIYLRKPTPDGRSRKLIHSSLGEPVTYISEVYSCAANAGQSIEEIESVVPPDTPTACASGIMR